MNTNEEIIVFRKFDSAIEASIIKTKLDAYDIPCFLTEENLANLYPGQNLMMFSVRLHLFAKDEECARKILSEANMSLNDESTTTCPSCLSNKIERDFPRRFNDSFTTALKASVFGIFFPKQKVYRCIDCECEFDIP
jgi:hypothetical protein